MKVTVLLADFAQGGPGQKINAIGLGWSRVKAPLGQHTLVLIIEAAPDEEQSIYGLRVILLDQSAEAVTDASGNPIRVDIGLEVGNADPSVPSITPVCINLQGGLPLEPGVYRWEVSSPEVPDLTWGRPFEVLPRDESDEVETG